MAQSQPQKKSGKPTAAPRAGGFPREFNQHLTDVVSKEYLAIQLILVFIFFPLMFYLQSLPPREMTQEELERLIQVIYRVEPQPQVVERVVEAEESSARQVEEDEIVEVSAEERQERREQRNRERQERLERMRQAAMSRGIFAQAGALSAGGGRGGRRGSGRTLGGGGLSGVSASGLSGIARGTEVAAVERLRGGGAVTEGAGDIDVSELSMEEVELLLSQSTVEVESVPETRGRGATSASRDAEVILAMVQSESQTLRNCYNTQKRKDPNLQGRVVVRYTITSDGSVQRVQMRNTQWTNNQLGRQVESCLRRRVSSWRFNPASGDVTTEFSLVFS